MQPAPPNKNHQERWPTAAAAFDRELKAAALLNLANERLRASPDNILLLKAVEVAASALRRVRSEYLAACVVDEKVNGLSRLETEE